MKGLVSKLQMLISVLDLISAALNGYNAMTENKGKEYTKRCQQQVLTNN